MKTIHPGAPLRGELSVPGDKSISHRAVMFGALSEGKTVVKNFLNGADCLSTISCFQQMGIDIETKPEEIIIHGRGLHGLSRPDKALDVGNSGTTTRLLSGILAGQPFDTVLTGDNSIQSRPMKRIITPLSLMGATVESIRGNGCAPLRIHGKQPLSAIHYDSPVASAQVKSCILLAGLFADGITSVSEPALSRDHTERMLNAFGAKVTTLLPHSQDRPTISIEPNPALTGREIFVPGDISSAAYFLAAGLLIPGSEILLKNVGVNPTRDGMLRVCEAMGANIKRINETDTGGEPTADLLVKSGSLHGTTVGGSLIPALIDELPMIAVMAAFAEGTTVIKDAAELKVKESDRIAVMTENLTRMGVDVEPREDGMRIHGGHTVHGASLDPHLDHRVAMSLTVAALAAEGESQIKDADCVRISYPGFFKDVESLIQ